MGRPSSPEGRFSRFEGWGEEGKMVESVPWGVRWRMRRARIADSREVGILKSPCSEGGFERMCCGEGGVAVAAARGSRERSRMSILVLCLLGSV